jgi:VIT1/CCC1 family predicted Fe2+/Mn2+ transporter
MFILLQEGIQKQINNRGTPSGFFDIAGALPPVAPVAIFGKALRALSCYLATFLTEFSLY